MEALPDLEAWLAKSWEDFSRRWGSLMLVVGLGALATAFAALLPLGPALAVALSGAFSPWAVWGTALFASLLSGLWVSTWAQAALMRACSRDEDGVASLGATWPLTASFAWTSTLLLVAAGGAFALLILPGLILGAVLFSGLFYHLDGEAEGLAALELAWGRAMAAPLSAVGRLALSWTIAVAPAWIPWLGWLVGPLWAPFGLVAAARLAADLKSLAPAPPKPRLLGPALALLSCVLALSAAAGGWGAYRLYLSAREVFAAGVIPGADNRTAQAVLSTIKGQADPEQTKLALDWAMSLSSSSETLKALLPPGSL